MLDQEAINHYLNKITLYDSNTVELVLPELLDHANNHLSPVEIDDYEMLVYYLDGFHYGESGSSDYEFRRNLSDSHFKQFSPKLTKSIRSFLKNLNNAASNVIFKKELESAIKYWDMYS